MKLIHSITLPDYPVNYEQSKKQRATYYDFSVEVGVNDTKYPKKYQDESIYEFKIIAKKGFGCYRLYDRRTGNPVIKNEAKVGTPRVKPIMGQDLFNLQGNAHNHTKILNVIKEWFLSHWDYTQFNIESNFQDFKYPLIFRFIYKNPKEVDIDNHRIFYEKAIIDCLKVFKYSRNSSKDKLEKVFNPVGFLQEDSSRFLFRVSSEWEEAEERSIILQIYEK